MVQYGWKKELKVDHPVEVTFMSVNCGKNEYSSLKFSNASFAIEPKVCANKKQIVNDGAKVYNILNEKVANKSKLKEEGSISLMIIFSFMERRLSTPMKEIILKPIR